MPRGRTSSWSSLKKLLEVVPKIKEELRISEARENTDPSETKQSPNQNIKIDSKNQSVTKKADLPKDIKKTSPTTTTRTSDPLATHTFDPVYDAVDVEWVSGDLNALGGDGEIDIFTDKDGNRREFHRWIDKAGYVQQKVLKFSGKAK